VRERRGLQEDTTSPNTTVPVAESETAQAPALGIVKADGERVEVEVEIADTRTEQARGLIARTELAEDAGILLTRERAEARVLHEEHPDPALNSLCG
jgi:uncharacterized protein DUF192 probably involved in sugar metabolism